MIRTCRLLHPALLVGALALAGCAAQADLGVDYGHALFDWRNAPRADLLGRWGTPWLAAGTAADEELTWVATEAGHVPSGQSAVAYTRPGPAAAAIPGVPSGGLVATVPMRCITRFRLRDGIVKDWSFEGVACGAPGFMPPAR